MIYLTIFYRLLNVCDEEQIMKEFTLDGAVTQVRSEEIGRDCLHSNATGCQLHACICFNRTHRVGLAQSVACPPLAR